MVLLFSHICWGKKYILDPFYAALDLRWKFCAIVCPRDMVVQVQVVLTTRLPIKRGKQERFLGSCCCRGAMKTNNVHRDT